MCGAAEVAAIGPMNINYDDLLSIRGRRLNILKLSYRLRYWSKQNVYGIRDGEGNIYLCHERDTTHAYEVPSSIR